MTIGGGGPDAGAAGAAAKQFCHGSVFLNQVWTEGIGLSHCLLEGPEDCTVGAFGNANKRMRFGPGLVLGMSRAGWDVRLGKGRIVVKIVAQGLRELAS